MPGGPEYVSQLMKFLCSGEREFSNMNFHDAVKFAISILLKRMDSTDADLEYPEYLEYLERNPKLFDHRHIGEQFELVILLKLKLKKSNLKF